MAALKDIVRHATETRRQTVALRAEMSRLTRKSAEVRRVHVERRESCHEAYLRARETRTRVPSWPAWGAPTEDLRSTLVPLD